MSPESRRAERYRQRQVAHRRRIMLAVGLPVVVALLVAAVVWAVSRSGSDEPPFAGTTLQLELGDYFIEGDLTAPAGAIRLDAVNVGNDRHNVGIRGVKISRELQSGESLTLDVGELAAGEYELYCDLMGHVEAGMVNTLVIT